MTGTSARTYPPWPPPPPPALFPKPTPPAAPAAPGLHEDAAGSRGGHELAAPPEHGDSGPGRTLRTCRTTLSDLVPGQGGLVGVASLPLGRVDDPQGALARPDDWWKGSTGLVQVAATNNAIRLRNGGIGHGSCEEGGEPGDTQERADLLASSQPKPPPTRHPCFSFLLLPLRCPQLRCDGNGWFKDPWLQAVIATTRRGAPLSRPAGDQGTPRQRPVQRLRDGSQESQAQRLRDR
ncbi:MAG: hypothetical protein JWQ81_8023 [Amycolatopsis sp.]|nr:hypothetical protein [Amycolatopsis sp.]